MHDNHISTGPPFDHKKPITCPDCIDSIMAQRVALCEKYGWSEWPFDDYLVSKG